MPRAPSMRQLENHPDGDRRRLSIVAADVGAAEAEASRLESVAQWWSARGEHWGYDWCMERAATIRARAAAAP